jgi:NTE family protein
MPQFRARLAESLVWIALTVCVFPRAVQAHPSSATPGERPIVGLALSGGGARGLAHVGVLKALEELHVRVDRVAGTSMGAVVGGLFACGYSASEIEAILLEVDWGEVFRNTAPRSRMAFLGRQESSRYLVSLPMKGLRVQVPAGVTEGEKLTSLLSLLTATAADGGSFDQLPIPFRAVATDLATGERVILDSGSLAEAIRASLAVPLLFTPAELGGRLLVDGGLTDNLPTDVARDMGSDLVIGSDVTTPLRGPEELTSPLAVGDQALSLQIAATTRGRRELADAVILPDLPNVLPTDFARAREIIRAGYEAALANPDLRSIAEKSPDRGAEPGARRSTRVIDGIQIRGTTGYSRRKLEALKRSLPGTSSTFPELQRGLKGVLGDRYFHKVRYRLAPAAEGRTDLIVEVFESRSDAFNLGGRIDDKYGALGLLNLTFRNLGGGDNQASFDFQVGSFSRFGAEFLHPSVPGTSFFFRPQLFWSHDFQLGYSDSRQRSEFVDRRYGGEVQVGNTFRNLGVVTLGYRLNAVNFHLGEGEEVFAPFRGRVASLVLRSRIETFDRAEIPDRGRLIDFMLESARSGLGGEPRFDRAGVDYSGYHTWGKRHTLTTGIRLGTSFADELPVFEQFRLGGEDYLTGLRREEIRGNHVAGIRAGYRFLLADLGNSFLSRIYLEVGADAANAWADRDHLTGGLTADGYVSLMARTWVGPMCVTVGAAEGGNRNATLSIGHRF